MNTRILHHLLLFALSSAAVQAQETLCAKVQLEIRQEVSFSRQAFEARMGISNSLPSNLTNVQVTLKFADENGTPVAGTATTVEDATAYFFYRPDVSPPGTTAQPHPTTIAAGTAPTLVWTIIPTLTAANGAAVTSAGVIYQISAELRYTTDGKDETVTVNPDFIRVKPLPKIQLDYFLPYDVSGDDPLTPVVEPPVPFSLAVRARNVGKGTAKQLTLESSPPKIVRNDLDAPVQFTINATRVNDGLATPSLLVDAGDLLYGAAAMIRWELRSRLAGRFTSFTAVMSHSDELGGALTALMAAPATHRLEGEVRVDLPGRDGVVDILAFDSMTSDTSPLRVYESQSVDPSVAANLEPITVPTSNINMAAIISGGVIALDNAAPTGTAFSYVRGTDPWSGARAIKRVVRSDGKVLPAQNVWLSRHYGPPSVGAAAVTVFRVHVFDWLPVGTGAVSWAIEFESGAMVNHAPVLGPLANRIVKHGQPVSFGVSASDPDGQLVSLSLPTRPYGAQFTTDNNGTGTFTWTPGGQSITQTGDFPLTFSASDGLATTSRTTVLTVTSGDQLSAWKNRWWSPGDAAAGNSADPDGDGLSNLYEYALDLDPTHSSTHQRPVLSRVTLSGKHYLALTTTYRTDDATLVVDMVGSGDAMLANPLWQPVSTGETVEPAATPPGFRRARFIDTTALEDSATGRFVRLHVSVVP